MFFFCQGSKKRTEKIDDFPSLLFPSLLLLCTTQCSKKENNAIENESMSNCIITSIDVFGKILTHTYDGVDSNNLLKDQNILTTTAIFSALFWKARLKKSDISV